MLLLLLLCIHGRVLTKFFNLIRETRDVDKIAKLNKFHEKNVFLKPRMWIKHMVFGWKIEKLWDFCVFEAENVDKFEDVEKRMWILSFTDQIKKLLGELPCRIFPK